MKARSRGLWILLLFSGLLWIPAVASAQEGGPSDDAVNAIAHQLYCPVCENIPLDVCPTQACIQWRGVIRQMLSEGRTEQEIKDYFVEQYGDRVLATPPAQGFNWLAYVIPPAAFLGGAIVLVRTIRAWRRPGGPPSQAAEPPVEDPFIERLEQELRKRA
jgi:cytochrome c-type biogenesis protein CcmH